MKTEREIIERLEFRRAACKDLAAATRKGAALGLSVAMHREEAAVAELEWALQPSAIGNRLSAEPVAHAAGVCWICDCTESAPCMDAWGHTCAWIDRTRTLCSNCAEIAVLNAQWGAALSPDRGAPQFQKLAELAAEIYAQATAAAVEVVELATPEEVQAIIAGGRIQ